MDDTDGGDMDHGLAAYRCLRDKLTVPLFTYNVGAVRSVGIVIFLAGGRRYAKPGSTFTFHPVAFEPLPGEVFTEESLSQLLESIRSDQREFGAILKERTRIPEEDIPPLFRDEWHLDPQEALRVGLIDAVLDVEVPAGARYVRLAPLE